MKSGHHHARALDPGVPTGPGSSRSIPNDLWKAIWKIKAPPKVRLFMWKACCSAVPTKENLFRRKCSPSAICPICNSDTESIENAILFCNWARVAWFSSALSLKICDTGFCSFDVWVKGWLLDCVDLDDFARSLIAIQCWEIWKCRCSFIFQNQSINPIFTSLKASSFHNEFWQVQLSHHAESYVPNEGAENSSQMDWTTPDDGAVKFNIDGAFQNASVAAGIAVIVRNSVGVVCDGFCDTVITCSAFATECLALLKACNMALSFGSITVNFETDCKDLVSAIASGPAGFDWRCDTILQNISDLFLSNPSWSLTWIPRLANNAADWVAKQAAKKMFPLGWVGSPPFSLASILSKDLSSACVSDSVRLGVG